MTPIMGRIGNYLFRRIGHHVGSLTRVSLFTRRRVDPAGTQRRRIDPRPFDRFGAMHLRVSQLVGWFTAALQVPEVKAKLAVQGLYPVGKCGADFGAFIRKQYDDYGRAIREANIKPQ